MFWRYSCSEFSPTEEWILPRNLEPTVLAELVHPFDLVVFLKTPQVILRILAWVTTTKKKNGYSQWWCIASVLRFLRSLSLPVSPKKDSGTALAATTTPILVVMGSLSAWSHFCSQWFSPVCISIFQIYSSAKARKVVVLVEMILSGRSLSFSVSDLNELITLS